MRVLRVVYTADDRRLFQDFDEDCEASLGRSDELIVQRRLFGDRYERAGVFAPMVWLSAALTDVPEKSDAEAQRDLLREAGQALHDCVNGLAGVSGHDGAQKALAAWRAAVAGGGEEA